MIEPTNPPMNETTSGHFAEQLARSHTRAQPHPRAKPSLLESLTPLQRTLRTIYYDIQTTPASQRPMPYAAEWLLDNFYQVERAFRQVRQDMPQDYYRRLPQLDTDAQPIPRVYTLARQIIGRWHGNLDTQRLIEFLDAYQQVTPLTIGELWALPTMLRIAVLELLVGILSPEVEAFLPEDADVEAAVGQGILCLRTIDTLDWNEFVEAANLVDRTLRRDPSGTYETMDFDTRDRYRRVVENLAMGSCKSETEVAEAVVELAEQVSETHSTASSDRRAHIGYYLLGPGRPHLESYVNYRPPLRARLLRYARRYATPLYIGSIVLLSLVFTACIALHMALSDGTAPQLAIVVIVGLIPASELAISMINWLVAQTVPPNVLPKLDFSENIPDDCRTMIVVPVLLRSTDDIDASLRKLECRFLGNQDANLSFALLTDFAEASTRDLPTDAELLEHVTSGIRDLNQQYAHEGGEGPFFLLHREREWNESEGCWLGWERKRGKLEQFNRRIAGEEHPFSVEIGDLDKRLPIHFVVTLDDDTELPGDTARRLVGTMAHPLNRPVRDPETGRVTDGYTILQPRVEVVPTHTNQSFFTRVFAGDSGLDLYSRAVSDVYQDLFGEGIYVGKGMYDVQAFRESLQSRVPENTLLSHDLFEGIHGRVGLVTDILLYEDFPPDYVSYARRQYRWVRGDWQLLPWLGSKTPCAGNGRIPTTLSAINRWKILDNLRRSLTAPALLIFFILGWLWFPGRPWVWISIGLAASASHIITVMLQQLLDWLRGVRPADVEAPLSRAVLRWLLRLVFLPYEALLVLNAIARTLFRVYVSHKHLLQWTTAAHTASLFGVRGPLALAWSHMGTASCLAMSIGMVLLFLRPGALLMAGLLLLSWVTAPFVAVFISKPRSQVEPPPTPNQVRELRVLARRTWHYFEDLIGPDDHWLPPDHFQEFPNGTTAHRTSPTNLGMTLLSTLAAYDLGYTTLSGLISRLRFSFDTIENLERHRGHFLNWYDTRSLAPLPPRYVSTVDSSNLVACLITLRQGLERLIDEPLLRPDNWLGLVDALMVLAETFLKWRAAIGRERCDEFLRHLDQMRETLQAAAHMPVTWPRTLAELVDQDLPAVNTLLARLVTENPDALTSYTLRQIETWYNCVESHVEELKSDMSHYIPWLDMLTSPPELFESIDVDPYILESWQRLHDALTRLPTLAETIEFSSRHRNALQLLTDAVENQITTLHHRTDHRLTSRLQEALEWCQEFARQLENSRLNAQSIYIGLQTLSRQSEALCAETDFTFLFDDQRKVFHIGYDLDAAAEDRNHYDLLASESRIASLLAIAKGQVPRDHWIHLARPITRVNGTRALLSWSGTMFEYLMPSLLMRSSPGTLLEHSDRAAIAEQITYAKRLGTPWGISESGYYRFDSAMNYQYQAFGVPTLAFKRGLQSHHVIAPYASLLALPYRPQAVLENVLRLQRAGIMGEYGFYEAVDYTRRRIPTGRRFAVVQSFMVHHQGMSLLAITNTLRHDIMVSRFTSDPRIQAVQLLLEERVPTQAPLEFPHRAPTTVEVPPEPVGLLPPWSPALDSRVPQAHVLSNGSYSLIVTASGSGYSTWQDVGLTRWQPDSTCDSWGTWLYMKDMQNGAFWSVTQQPVSPEVVTHAVTYYTHMAEFLCHNDGVSVRTQVLVAPEHDVELRRMIISNDTDRDRTLWAISYGEVSLAPAAEDQRHPAFSKLFIESEYVADVNGLLYRRRPRSATERPAYLLHSLVTPEDMEPTRAYESDRSCFIGRGNDIRCPAALEGPKPALTGTTGATLDPVMALGQEISLPAHSTSHITFVTAAAESRLKVLDLASQFASPVDIDRIFIRAQPAIERDIQQIGLGSTEVQQAQRLLSMLLYPVASLRAAPDTIARNTLWQSGLWGYAVSGDYPIVLLLIGEQEQMPLIREMLTIHAYWRSRQLMIDLVILNERAEGYDQALQGQILQLLTETENDDWLNQRGGIFVVRSGQMPAENRVLLESAARVILDGTLGSIDDNLRRVPRRPMALPAFTAVPTPGAGETTTPQLTRPTNLLFDNTYGGFSPDCHEYLVYVEPDRRTPAPWINVVANPEFGFTVSELGSGYTWAGNSGENRLTSWHNDPVSNTPSEAIYLRDEETGELWSPTPLPAPASAPYLVRHGAGYTVFEHNGHGLIHLLRMFVAPMAPVKILHLKLHNTWQRPRRITVTLYVEWVLGTTRATTQQFIVPEYSADSNALLARNTYSADFARRVAFAAADRPLHGLTTDRTEFLGRNGSVREPAALKRIGLSGTVTAGLDPCAAIQIHLDLAADQTEEVLFLIGQGGDREEAHRLIRRYVQPEQAQSAWEEAIRQWDEILGAVQVTTPDPAMDLMLNRWLLYQALACRIWGRSALYQSSGAFGFRDQLQDVMAFVHTRPDLVRAHILRAARHQFAEGDVLHWWHPPGCRGVRTRISDDLLWLPYVTAHYVTSTGDVDILDEPLPFLNAPPLKPGEHERYAQYEPGAEQGTLYEHCLRAIERGATTSPRGLPLIGHGDWNDGMNRVGVRGRGESIWLGWFLYDVLTRFARIAEERKDQTVADNCRRQAEQFRLALEEHAWDGSWYIRATYDDGTPLGSFTSDDCQIDAVAQAWAVLSGGSEPERAHRALASVAQWLVREDDGLILLLAPPFDRTLRDPGYIKGYVPGIRENGGQYTHAAIWTIWAFAQLGHSDYAAQLFRMLNPVDHADSPEACDRYKVEPYVVAADVYSRPPHVGRGGWTWYTGSAGWMYRLGIEGILGIQRHGSMLRIQPSIPSHWRSYDVTYQYGSATYHVHVDNTSGVNRRVREILLDGQPMPDGRIPLNDDGQPHTVRVLMG